MTCLQFRYELKDIEPLIWRRILVSDKSTFFDLHVTICDTMKWEGYHLHRFDIGNDILSIMNKEYLLSYDVKIKPYLKKITQFKYCYDFGDDWNFDITYEGSFKNNDLPELKYNDLPLCIDGQNAAPPEDIGGPNGYEYFLEALQTDKSQFNAKLQKFKPTSFQKYYIRYSDPELIKQMINDAKSAGFMEDFWG